MNAALETTKSISISSRINGISTLAVRLDQGILSEYANCAAVEGSEDEQQWVLRRAYACCILLGQAFKLESQSSDDNNKQCWDLIDHLEYIESTLVFDLIRSFGIKGDMADAYRVRRGTDCLFEISDSNERVIARIA